MATVAMQKIRLLTYKGDKPKVMAFLQEHGVLHITDVTTADGLEKLDIDEEGREMELLVAELDFVTRFLAGYEAKKKGLQAKIDGNSVGVSNDDIEKIIKDYKYKEAIERVKSVEEELANLSNEVKSIEGTQARLRPWTHLKLKLADPRETENAFLHFAAIPLKDYEAFKTDLLNVSKLVVLESENVSGDTAYIQVVGDQGEHNKVEGLIAQYKAEIIELPELDGTPSEEIDKLDVRLKQIAERQGQLNKAAKELAKELPKLRIAYDYFSWKLQQKQARKNFAGTESSVVITGWMPKKGISAVAKDLENTTKAFELTEVEPDEDEAPPVLLENKGIMKPFQSVTGIYGLPLPTELDPTPYLAIFFISFYALALTDAVYGLLMFAVMFSVLRYLKIPKQSQGLIRLLMYCGLFTFFIGALFGGWAAMTTEQAPAFMTTVNAAGESIFVGQKISALTNPLGVLILSLVLGYLQVFVGVCMDFFWKIKQGAKVEAWVDVFPWVYNLAIIAVVISISAGLLPASFMSTAKLLLYAGLIGIVLTQGRSKKNIIMKFVSGLLGLYNFVGYLSDVLSYSRLLALGLATSIIGLAVNTIAGLVSGLPYVGIVFAILVLAGGHLFNIGINALGAFIHSGRLQFVEFFTKFLEGGGKAFNPLSKKSKFIRIKN